MSLFRLVRPVAIAIGLGACAGQPAPHPFAAFRTYAPASVAVAQFPTISGGSESYQDHSGVSVALGSAPAMNDTGSERIPDYPAGPEPQIVQGRSEVLMPNGGETIVQSTNSLP
jgi:hypothetical protein